MKNILILFALLFLGCRSSNFDSFGTTGSRYGIKPFPSKDKWVTILNNLTSDKRNKSDPTILWVVGSYSDSNIKLNFPGKNNRSYNILYSEIDLNRDYLNHFDKNDIDVYLLIEPGNSNLSEVIRSIVRRYSEHKSVKGICVDLEWFRVDKDNPFGAKADINTIKSILFHVKSVNKNYKLILKHWNIYNIDHFPSSDIMYLQSFEGIKSTEELTKRHQLWYRKFYPSSIGAEVGFDKDKSQWETIENPVVMLPNILNSTVPVESSFFWSESSLYILD